MRRLLWLVGVLLVILMLGSCNFADAKEPLAQPACEWIEVESQDIPDIYIANVYECESSGARCLLVLSSSYAAIACFQLEGQ
jgi:hypothetical protein